ncbi:hypothetical protein M6B38_268185 [Iris pallida]|uniref:Secreted protein n=1 Tax=Iris pallida TaxID=29817 RepID=A0AAX6I9Y3_IRIPA|nr:hypothetical protein M6B38_129105 [Iris pallida]KAJ6849677.1 hypothetical protein M6B38_268185 [Iris pallida]
MHNHDKFLTAQYSLTSLSLSTFSSLSSVTAVAEHHRQSHLASPGILPECRRARSATAFLRSPIESKPTPESDQHGSPRPVVRQPL